MAVAPHDGDLPIGVRFDVQIHCAPTQPLVESPLLPLRQGHTKVARIVLNIIYLGFRDSHVIQCLPACAETWNGRRGEKMRPGGDPFSPQSPFRRASYPGKQAEGRCDHDASVSSLSVGECSKLPGWSTIVIPVIRHPAGPYSHGC